MNKNNQDNKTGIFSKIIQKNKFDTEKNNQNGNDNVEEQNGKNYYWYIEIPSIFLKAPINEGVDSETLQAYVGHFQNTSLKEGNIGLAAHNRRIQIKLF